MNPYAIAKWPFRPLLYGLLLIYLALDFGLEGPLRKRVSRALPGSEASQEFGADQDWAATVNGSPITKAQLDLAIDLFLARRGKLRADLTRENLEITQLAVLNSMINDELIRLWSRAQPRTVPEQWLDGCVGQFESAFAPGELKQLCRQQGLSQSAMRARLREHFRQVYWLGELVSESTTVTEAETKEWFEFHKAVLIAPEMIRARHIFLSTVTADTPEVEGLAKQIHRSLASGEASFERLAKEHSEDDRTKYAGGDLGWFTRTRLPADFAGQVFEMQPGQLSPPFRTKIGWHVVEVLERKPTRPWQYEELKEEIAVQLENQWRIESLNELMREQLRIPRRARVEVFAPAMELEPAEQ